MDGGEGPDPEVYPMRMENGVPDGTMSSLPCGELGLPLGNAVVHLAGNNTHIYEGTVYGRQASTGMQRFVLKERAERDAQYNKVAHKNPGPC